MTFKSILLRLLDIKGAEVDGIAFSWIGVGFSYPASFTAACSF